MLVARVLWTVRESDPTEMRLFGRSISCKTSHVRLVAHQAVVTEMSEQWNAAQPWKCVEHEAGRIDEELERLAIDTIELQVLWIAIELESAICLSCVEYCSAHFMCASHAQKSHQKHLCTFERKEE